MHLPHAFKGLDDTAMETAYIGVSAIVAIVVFAYILNSPLAQRLASVPFVGRLVTGGQAVVGQVARS
ncbi:MAG: hypothetical protein ABSD62_14650 [Candidatus Limnocylindrales bacterium]|jgi:hypothetical protein